MQMNVLIERVAGNGYRARGGEPFALVVEAPTREEALTRLKEACEARLRNGSELVTLEVNPTSHPLAKFVGMFNDDPLIDDWKESMAEYRRKIDEEPDLP
jgi:hypothetical protein